MLLQAQIYNQELAANRSVHYYLSDEEQKRYDSLVDLNGTGVMGYIEIPSIQCTLPVYHGIDDNVLNVAIGHLEWSSLPVGGESTHTVLSGHRGLPSARLFTDIDRLVVGDQFYLSILGDTLAYEVDQILIVLPEEMDALTLEEGQDLCTLVTCTPYGVNSHRLLVRGHRVAYKESNVRVVADALVIDKFIIAIILGTIIVGILIVWMLVWDTLRKKKKPKQEKTSDENREHSSEKKISHEKGGIVKRILEKVKKK